MRLLNNKNLNEKRQIAFIFDGKKMGKYPLIALESIEKSSFFSRMWDEILLLAN